MIERTIFRNIQHVPRVWGVTYMKLFATLGCGLLITTAGFALASGTTGKITVIITGVIVTLTIHGVCLWMDKTDALDRDHALFLRNETNSQSMSLQRIRFQGEDHALQ